MKAIRIAALGVALIAGSAAVAGAQAATAAPQQQGGPGGGGGGGRGMQRTLNGIELTDAQKTKLAEINTKYAPEMTALREAMQGGDRAEGMKKMQALREKMTPEVRAVLTAEQQAVYDKNVAEQKARFEEMQKSAGANR